MINKRLAKSQGFTLVELSIVIIIIGFLIAGIAAGQSLIKQAQLNAVVQQLITYKNAIQNFQYHYGYLPGDLPTASSYWPSLPIAGNGDGNGAIDGNINTNTPLEDTYTWNHLSLAGLIDGSFTGGALNPRFTPGANVPAARLGNDNAGYMLHISNPYTHFRTVIELGSIDVSLGYLDYGALTSQDAYSIDNKIDDGKPATGSILVASGWNLDFFFTSTNYCVDSSQLVDTTAVNFVLTDTTPSCRVWSVIDTD